MLSETVDVDLIHMKNTLKAFDSFKKNQKSVWSNIFWYVNVLYVYSKSAFNTLYIEIKCKY